MKKELFTSSEKITEIAGQFPTPFHLYDEKGIRETARALYDAFSWNPGFKEYFAVKATPNPTILRILREEGCGVDCASDTELLLSEKSGFTGDEMFFSSNDTPADEYLKAAELGATINLDAYEHIEFLKNLPGWEFPETMCLRFNPGGTFSLGTEIMDMPEESKFGMTHEQIFKSLKELTALGVKHFGIHSFLASNTVTNAYYPTLAKKIFELAVEIKMELGITLDFVNLSGGIGVPYRPEEEANNIKLIGDGVRKVYEEVLIPAAISELRIFTELGRFMLAPNGLLITKVLHLKHTYRDYVGVDASAVNLMRPAMYGAYHHITVVGKEEEPEVALYDVTGSLCENNDKFAKVRALPEVAEGDLLAIHDTGAHGFSMGYQYNGKLRSSEILLREDGTPLLIRRAETPDDYFATFHGLTEGF